MIPNFVNMCVFPEGKKKNKKHQYACKNPNLVINHIMLLGN